ncbi:MAG: EamA family transporter [Bacilli bacterium]|nr:EamA family transporter [Bacilli bacterium]
MWIIYTLMTFLCWGIADVFYKIGNKGEEEYNHLKTGIMVGLVMGIHASIILLTSSTSITLIDIIKYLPISFCYISSMVIGYRGLKYLELSISSPIQNTSGIITALLLMIFFKESYDYPFFIALVLIIIGITGLSMIQIKENKEDRIEYKKNNSLKKVFTLTILFPLVYCLLDGAGTFLDGIFLDKLELVNEDTALVAYEYTFLIYGIITYFYLRKKKQVFNIVNEKPKLAAAIFETAGQFFYVYAMSGNATITAPIVGSYCILSMILSRIFLKEKLTKKEYIYIFLVLIGIIILAILDI